MADEKPTTGGTTTSRPTAPYLPGEPGAKTQLTQLGRYRILKPLGVGGSATVHLALDTTIDKKVALKVLHEHLRSDPVTVRRFANDARALAKLNHAGIVQIHSAELDQYYFAMEHVDGVSLASLLARDGSLPPERAVLIAIQAAEALAHIHREGLLHRDVKPGNLIVAPGDRVKLTDFSIARETGETMLTLRGSLVGTVEYMSPEQIREEDVDVRTDVYALGAVLYEMLTGRPPFVRDTATTEVWPLMEKILNEPPRLPRELNPAIPAELETLVMRALAKSAADRVASMDELLIGLRKIGGGATTLAMTPVVLAAPTVGPEGVRFSWTRYEGNDFTAYEVHGADQAAFVPNDSTRLWSFDNQDGTEMELPLPPSKAVWFYRVRILNRSGLPLLSNRVAVEPAPRPPIWRRRWFPLLVANTLAAIITLGLVFFRPAPPAVVSGRSGNEVRVTGAFTSARYFPATGDYRLSVSAPELEVLTTNPLAETLVRNKPNRLLVRIPGEVAAELEKSGVDLILLGRQAVTARGVIEIPPEDKQQEPVLTVAKPADLELTDPAPKVVTIDARDWKQHENQEVQITAPVVNVDLSSTARTVLLLEPDVKVVIFAATVAELEAKGITLADLKGKTVRIIGRVGNHVTYKWQVILNHQRHFEVVP